jgi:hypothetical protein
MRLPTQRDLYDITGSSQVSVRLSLECSDFAPQTVLAVGTKLFSLIFHSLLYIGFHGLGLLAGFVG